MSTPHHSPAADPTSQANTAALRRVPASVFTLAYGATIIAILAGGAVMIANSHAAEPAPPSVGRPLRAFNPVETSLDNVTESLRPYLLGDASTARTSTGVTLTATMTQQAQDDLADFSGHVSRLLEQNCIDSMTVKTQDNLRINIWGYCYFTPGPVALQTYITDALDGGADSVAFSAYPGRPIDQEASLIWFTDSVEEGDKAVESWDDLDLVPATDQLSLVVYDPERVRVRGKFSEETSRVETNHEDDTGEAFAEKWR
ncbi:hypothetical protein [Corynebacterium liangguodongii]|uniref:Uncharacterized protein n=1 Tax=Corynebacterium liangguodongii TaxID=2079535 RepID=A0A2S0WF73_9CORY|nr:hypothetical protein [Corynebacterium liangguodongii]AWB84400.1 hypothetical protein C3E79_07815 [Corynebacterium liangguodongii]PWB99890.1 hypothetical protein DF219_04410 [Corynebacterium liangguodongii]